MLRGQDDYHSYVSQQKSFKPYFDPELADNHSTYGDFLTRLHAAGMLRFRASHETCGALGIFFVRKKDDSLRLIFDTRKLNMRFKDPPKTELPTASAMSNIESFDSSNVYLGSGDIKNAFYSLRVPDALSDLFTLPRIRARYLPASLRASFEHEDTWVTPCLTVLPMGWNWALHLCQSFTSNVVKIACPDSSYFSDHSGSRHLSSPADTLTTCYVDNFCVLGHDPKLVDLQLSKIHKHFSNLGCIVHEQCPASVSAEFVGLNFAHGSFSIKTSRIWRLRFALQFICRMKHVSGHMLEIVIGHLTWAMLLRRESLALLHHVYMFIHTHRHTVHMLTPEVRQELSDASAILPLLRSDVHRGWGHQVHASDASPFGLGVCARTLRSKEIAVIGRTSEKWRFRVEASIHARRSALNCAKPDRQGNRELDLLLPGCPALSDNQLLDADKELIRTISVFDEVPSRLLRPEDWKVVSKYPVQSPQFITKLEGKALLLAVKHALRSAANFGCRHLFLVDNMSLCLAATKGRSSSPNLLHVCRKLACLSLATNIRIVTRWIPSELNIADGPSRGLNFPSGCNNTSHPLSKNISPRENTSQLNSHKPFEDIQPTPFKHHNRFRLNHGADPFSENQESLFYSSEVPVSCQKLSGLREAPPDDDAPRNNFSCPEHASRLHDPNLFLRALGSHQPRRLDIDLGAGYDPGAILRGAILETSKCSRGIKVRRMPEVHLSAAGAARKFQPTSIHPCSTIMGKATTQRSKGSAALDLSMRNIGGATSSRANSQCSVPLDPVHHSHASRSVRSPNCQSTGAADASCQRHHESQMGNSSLSNRIQDPRKDRRLRPLGTSGLSRLARSVFDNPNSAAASIRSTMGSHRKHSASGFSQCSDQPEVIFSQSVPIQPASRRGLARCLDRCQDPQRSKSSRTLAQRPVSGQVLQTDKSTERASHHPDRSTDVRKTSGEQSRAPFSPASISSSSIPRKHNSSHRRLSAGEIKDKLKEAFKDALKHATHSSKKLFLELFSGSGKVSRYFKRAGFASIAFDINNGYHFDLTNPTVVSVILGWISSGCILGVCLETQCSSWSRARRGPPSSNWCAIRSNTYIYGISGLRPCDLLCR